MTDAHLHIPTELHQRLKAHCERRGMALSDYAREVLEDALGIANTEPLREIALEAPRTVVAELVCFCRQHHLSPGAVLVNALEQEMRRERRKLLDTLPASPLNPDPLTLPPFWTRSSS